MHNPKVQLKGLAIIEYLIILYVLLIVFLTPPSTAYEISLYVIYPWYVWIGLAIPLIMPFLILSVKRFYDYPKILLVIYLGAILSIFLLFSFPIIRNYPFYGAGDIHSHLGYIFHLATTYRIGVDNPYPIIHILIGLLSLLLGGTPEQISLFFPQLFVCIFILSLYLLAKSFELDTKTSLIITSLGFLPIYGSFITVEFIFPSMDAFFLFPLFIYIFIKSRTYRNSLSFTLLTLPILLLIPYFHPEILIFYSTFIFLYILLSKIYKKYQSHFQTLLVKNEMNSSWTPILYLVLGLWIWSLSYIFIGSTIRALYNSLILNLTDETPPLQSLMGGFKREIIDVLHTLLVSYSPALIFLLLGFIISTFILINVIQKKQTSFWELLICCSFFVCIFLNIIFLLKGTAIGFHIYRQIKYSLLFCVLAIGIFYSTYIIQKEGKKFFQYCIILLIIISSMIGIFNCYPSPITQNINTQPTVSSIIGMSFFFENRDPNLLMMETGRRAFQNRYADYLLIENKQNVRWGYSLHVEPIPHFGYNEANNLGNFYRDSQYLLLYSPSRELYTIIHPKYEKYWKYSPSDYDLLKIDPTIAFFYDNGEMQFLKIKN